MNPDLVRVILVILGVLLVAGIYFWDRYKRMLPRLRRVPRRRVAQAAQLHDGTASRTEPTLSAGVASAGDLDEEPWSAPPVSSDPVVGHNTARKQPEVDATPVDLGDWSDTLGDKDAQLAMDLQFDVNDAGDYLHSDPALFDEVERKIIVINLVAREGVFAGTAIERAAAMCDMSLGEMSIFHRQDAKSGKVLFSMASMVEPGSFPATGLAEFSTPGLALFTQLPGARDGLEVFEAMLGAANRMAAQLRGDLRDERHNKLTRQMQEHIRESIIEHRRRIKLVRPRR